MIINITEKEAGTFVMVPEGNLDYITATEMDAADAETAKNANQLILDLSKINYIASAGLRVLLNADDLMRDKGGLAVTNANEYVMEVLEMTGFADALTII